jgi:hypothetical protein
MLLTVITGVKERREHLKEVVKVTLLPPISPWAPPTYLFADWRREFEGEKWGFKVGRWGWVQIKAGFPREVTEILPSNFSLERGSSRHLHGHNCSCSHLAFWLLGGRLEGGSRETVDSGFPPRSVLTLVWGAHYTQHTENPSNQLVHFCPKTHFQ